MKCRHCNADMEAGMTVCSVCGGDNAKPVKSDLWKGIIIGLVIAALMMGVMAAIYFGGQGDTHKTSYTGTEAQLKASMDTVVATAGNLKLTNGELQVAYWAMVYDFLNYYGDYASYVVDLTVPFDQQMVPDSDLTWQQYFLETALTSWRRYALLCQDAEVSGVEMSDELKDHFDTLYEDMKAAVAGYGFSTVEEMIAHDFGVGCDFADYESYMKSYYYGTEYYSVLYDLMPISDAEIEAYYTTRESDFISSGYGKDAGNLVTVRHLLLSPNEEKDATKDTFTEEEWANCLVEAQAMLAQWLTNPTEEYFSELAKEYSTCSSAADGGLIQNIMKGQMVTEFNDWIMAEGREYGQYGMVKTMYGYHIIFYVSDIPVWYEVAKSNLGSEMLTEQLNNRENEAPLVVDYSKIWLSDISLVE